MTFEMDEVEVKKANKFEKKHWKSCWKKSGAGAIGGGIIYIFMPTSIGNTCEIKCTKCKEKENITNFDNW